uniref:Uncharacterized protein n=1 Tax=Knipowitschia caucasica TaxID=637954 RepID=A0AAV2KAQ6_KNICA
MAVGVGFLKPSRIRRALLFMDNIYVFTLRKTTPTVDLEPHAWEHHKRPPHEETANIRRAFIIVGAQTEAEQKTLESREKKDLCCNQSSGRTKRQCAGAPSFCLRSATADEVMRGFVKKELDTTT